MGRPEKPVDTTGGSVAAFASELRRLRAGAGNPTYRDMAKSALFSSSVLSSAASGRRLPTLQVTLAFVAACGGDREVWRARWLQVAHAEPDAVVRPPWQAGPAQLPLRSAGFVGRQAELRALRVPSTEPIVITGPVGVGKSELALRFALDVAAPDGQLYADLGGGDTAHAVLGGFLRALGLSGVDVPETTDQRAGLFRTLLAQRALFVLLDNVLDEQQVRPLLAEHRRGMVIAVSRSGLLGLRGVRRVRVGALSHPDSVALLTSAVGERARDDPGAIARLAALCWGLPLALDIMARKLVTRPRTPLRLVAARLADPLVALDWLRIGDVSVQDRIADAHRRIGPEARALLDALVDAPSADPVTFGLADDEPGAELADAGLLHHVPGGTYRLDPFVRAYVSSRVPGVITPELAVQVS